MRAPPGPAIADDDGDPRPGDPDGPGAVDREHRDRVRSTLDLEDSSDPHDVLTRLCVAVAGDHGLLGAAVSLMTTTDAGRATSAGDAVAAASDPASRRLEEIQFGVGEGPGTVAFDTGQPVLVPDLLATANRWPGYAAEAARAGVCAVHTFPLQFGASRFGVLSCYSDRPRPLTPDELTSMLAFAEVATEVLLGTAGPDAVDRVHAGLPDALHQRTEIYQAQGMLTVQLGIGLAEALARMRAHAFSVGSSLTDVALGILDGTVRLPPATPPEPSGIESS